MIPGQPHAAPGPKDNDIMTIIIHSFIHSLEGHWVEACALALGQLVDTVGSKLR